jgi:hypothetical protein
MTIERLLSLGVVASARASSERAMRLTGICSCVLFGFVALPLGCTAQTPFTLNFEGIHVPGGRTAPRLLEFYNGGVSQSGTSGTNYGVTFSAGALGICTTLYAARCSNPAPPEIGGSFLAFEDRTKPIITLASGFGGGMSFLYAAPFSTLTQDFTIWSGIDGTGEVLGNWILGSTGVTPFGYEFTPLTVTFAGIARSVTFSSGDGVNSVLLDNITFGLADAAVVPEPAAVTLVAFGMCVLLLFSSRRSANKRRVRSSGTPHSARQCE